MYTKIDNKFKSTIKTKILEIKKSKKIENQRFYVFVQHKTPQYLSQNQKKIDEINFL